MGWEIEKIDINSYDDYVNMSDDLQTNPRVRNDAAKVAAYTAALDKYEDDNIDPEASGLNSAQDISNAIAEESARLFPKGKAASSSNSDIITMSEAEFLARQEAASIIQDAVIAAIGGID